MLVVACGSWIPRGRGLREGRLVRSVGRKVPPKPSNLRIDTIQTPSTELGCPTSASEVGRTPKQFGHIHRRSKKKTLVRAHLRPPPRFKYMHAHGLDATLFMRSPINSDPCPPFAQFYPRHCFAYIKSRDMVIPLNSAIAAGFRFPNLLAQDALWQPSAGWELRDSGCDPQENVHQSQCEPTVST